MVETVGLLLVVALPDTSVTGPATPAGGVPEAVAVLVTVPVSTSICVNV